MRVTKEKERLTLSDASSASWLVAGAVVLIGLFFTFNGLTVILGFTRGQVETADTMLIIGTVALAIGLWIVHISPVLQTIFEPSRNRVLIRKQRLMFSSPPHELSLQDLARLEIGSDQIETPDQAQQFALRLVTIEGKRIPICQTTHKQKKAFEDALSQTRAFLHSYGLMI